MIAAAVVLAIAPARGEIYRCTDSGKTIYSDKPCPASAAGKSLSVTGGNVVNATATDPQHEASMGRAVVGMTAAQLVQAWGEPQTKNVRASARASTGEQWVYRSGGVTRYAYLSNGVVDSLSTHETAAAPTTDAEPPRATRLEQERAAKAGERRFIRVGEPQGAVRGRLGEPDARTYAGTLEVWTYEPTPLDPQTRTRVVYDTAGTVYDVDRTVTR